MRPNQQSDGAESLLKLAAIENQDLEATWLGSIKRATQTLVRRTEILGLALPVAAEIAEDAGHLNFPQLRVDFICLQADLGLALKEHFPHLSREARATILMENCVLSEALEFSFRIGQTGGSIDWTKIKMNGQEFQEEIGKGIAKIRKKQGLTQTELAKRIGMTHASIARLEGGTQRLGMSVLYDIAKVMKVSPAVFLPREAFPPKSPSRISPERIRRVRKSLPNLPKVVEGMLNRHDKATRKGRKQV